MKKSKYSGQFGDYSSYSDEVEELTRLEEQLEEQLDQGVDIETILESEALTED